MKTAPVRSKAATVAAVTSLGRGTCSPRGSPRAQSDPGAGTTGRLASAHDQVLLEHDVERYLVERCHEHHWLCWKFTSPSRAGVPDRLIVTPDATVFVEVKRPGEHLRAKQQVAVREMREAGAHVYVADTPEAVDDLIAEIGNPS